MRLAERLLKLYPRAWRDRYGEEFLDMVAGRPLTLQQAIDIVSGAIDAWLSADVRQATRASAVTTGGPMSVKTLVMCGSAKARYTTRDSAIGAAVMIAATVLLSGIGMFLRRQEQMLAGDLVMNLAFSWPLLLSMPFWLLKGQPWKAQVTMIGGTALLVAAIIYFAVVNA